MTGKLLHILSRQNENFSLRIFFHFTLFSLVICSSFTALFFQWQRVTLRTGMINEGKLLAGIIAHNSRLGVFAENESLLREAADGVLQHKEVLNVAIYSKDGKQLLTTRNQSNARNREIFVLAKQPDQELISGDNFPKILEHSAYVEIWMPIIGSQKFTSESLLFPETAPKSNLQIGAVQLIIDKQPLAQKLKSLLISSILLAIAFLLIGSVAAFYLARGITRPLMRLTEGVRNLEQGEEFTPVKVETGDEIGRLAQAFNNMADTLQKRQSEKVQLTEQLQQSQRIESIGTLAGGVAHDFNNILTAIIGFTSLLQMSMPKDSPFKIYVDQILSASDRATTLVRRLLAFGRKQSISPKPADLNEVIRGIEKLLGRLITEDISFSVELAQGNLVAHVDTGQMDQVLINLATNARDAMHNGGKLVITSKEVELNCDFFKSFDDVRPGRYALISVSDTGCGMDEATKERIFDPFFTTKEVGKGTGLGLSMVYGIIKQHNGFIFVDSQPGEGTTIRIYLPLINGNAEKEQLQALPALKGNKETILLAEDDKAVRKLSKHVLERCGYNVIETSDGEEAVKKFMEHQDVIKLVLLDVVMPKRNGYAAYEAIRAMQPDVKVLFISGYTRDIINAKGIISEELNFIAKPVRPDELATKIKDLLQT